MHYWRLLLLAFLATLGPIVQADRLLVYGERRLLQEQERFCGKEARSLAHNTKSTLDGAHNEPSLQRERFEARTVTSRESTYRNAADRRNLNRDHQHFTTIRSSEDRSVKNQITRERSGERAREFRSARDITRREQRFSRDVQQNSHGRVHSPIQIRSERDHTKEFQRLTESRRTRDIHVQRENDVKRIALAQQSRRERTFIDSRSRSFGTTLRDRDSINEQHDRRLNSRPNYRVTDRVTSRSQQNDNRIYINSRDRPNELTPRERDNTKSQRDRDSKTRQSFRATEGIASRSQENDNRIFINSRGRSYETTRRERENINEQRDRSRLNSRQSYRVTDADTSRSQQYDNRIFTNSRDRSSELTTRERDNINSQRDLDFKIRQSFHASRSQENYNRILINSRGSTRRERESINEQRDRDLNSRSSYRDSKRSASRDRQSDYRIESRENSPGERIYDNRRDRDINRLSIRRVRIFDGEPNDSRFTREERNSVRVQSNDRRHSDAQVRQESLIGTNERDFKRNTETSRVRLTEREDFRQIDRRMASAPIYERVKFGNRQHPNQYDIESTTPSLTYLFYTLQGLYICSVLVHLAGIFKTEKKNSGFLHLLMPSSVGKEIKVD